MRRVEVDRLFPHPVQRVFLRYTDHAGWSDWAGLGRVRLTRLGSPEPNGVGAVRAFSTAPGLREEVTRFEPPSLMEYRVISGPIPLDDHHGEVRFTPEGSGTRVTWRVSFRSRIPGLGWPLERGLAVLFRRMLASLARDLDRRVD
jgi:uncharacterized protein YndB with AHSA1/START domain